MEIEAGELAVAYQNFLICYEMLVASILLRYGFPYQTYVVDDGMGTSLTDISGRLKSTLNPTDVVHDTIRNFSKKYGNYISQGDDEEYERSQQTSRGMKHSASNSAFQSSESEAEGDPESLGGSSEAVGPSKSKFRLGRKGSGFRTMGRPSTSLMDSEDEPLDSDVDC